MGESSCTFLNESDVLRYISENKSIYRTVICAIIESHKMFPQCQKVLELYPDAESDDEFLTLSIQFEEYPVLTLLSLRELKQKIYPSLKKAISGWISIIPERVCHN